MQATAIFFDRTTTLRSGWRFAIFICLLIIVGGLFSIVTASLLALLPISESDNSVPLIVVNAIAGLIPALAIGWLCGKYLERVPFIALGASFTRFWLSHLLLGCSIGGISVSIAALIAAAGGGLRFQMNDGADAAAIVQTLAFSLLVFSVAAAFEEALFRGYVLQTFARSGLAWFAILITSLFFGLAHFNNPNANLISTANTMLAGVWFGVAYLKTRDLWFVWGMHLIWNWMQGSVLGIEVSGLTDLVKSPLLKEIDTGPAWLTGGEYGLEGGFACTAALLISTLAIHLIPFIRRDAEMLALTSLPVSPTATNRAG